MDNEKKVLSASLISVSVGSATMLSEVFHSLADIVNQILLAIGIARAK
jgi:divalent metal cation (Fe/Co/Zn/Cd) transporter